MKSEPQVVMLHINDILPNRFQPRIKFNEDKINELAESIKKYGVIQPITVRKIGDKYEIIAGERRYKASVMAGLEVVPAIINNLNDKDSSEIALIENVQREDLTPIEEAVSYRKILDMGDMTQEDLAKKLGITQATVANKLRLLQLTDDVQEALLENKISERHARSLLRVRDKEKQVQLLYKIMQERMTVRKTDDEIKKILEEDLRNKGKVVNPGFMDIDKIEKEAVDIKDMDAPKNPKPSEVKIDEQEILDFINSLNVVKKEDKPMNSNDPVNQFDIPQINIIDDVPSEQVPPQPEPAPVTIMPESIQPSVVTPTNLGETPAMEPQTINPGFMDIDKIQREATDIAPPVEPVSESAKFMPNLQEQLAKEAPPAPTGKFFDVLPSMENANTNNIGMAEENPSPSIFSDASPIFSDLNIPSAPAPTQEQAPTEPINNILENPIIDPVPPVAPEVKEIVPEVAPPVPPIPTAPAVEPTIPDIAPVPEPQVAPVNPPIPEPIAPTIEPLRLDPIPPVPEPQPTYTPMGPEPIPNANKFEDPIIPLQPESMSTPPVPPAPSAPSIPEPVAPISPTLNVAKPLSFKVREGINMVRSIATQLESLGLKVDIEEVDLPEKYRISIELEK